MWSFRKVFLPKINIRAAFAVSFDRKILKPINRYKLSNRTFSSRNPFRNEYRLISTYCNWRRYASNGKFNQSANLILLMSLLGGFAAHKLNRENTESRVITRGASSEIVDDNPNLLVYPFDKSHPFDDNCQITIGDLHGNALKLIYFLIRQNVLDLNEQDYQDIVEIYQKNNNELTADDLKKYNEILERAQFHPIPSSALIRIIGDEVADRGSNDYFTLKVFEIMAKNKVPFEILFSNHGYEFIKVFELGLLENKSYLEKHNGTAISLTNLRLLVEKQLISMDEVTRLVKTYYQPHVKLLGYTLQNHISPWDIVPALLDVPQSTLTENITIYSHAPIGVNTVRAIALRENVLYSDRNAGELAMTIEQINMKFSQSVTQSQVLKTYGAELQQKVDVRDIPLTAPILRAIWSRGHQEKDQPLKSLNRFNLFYVHGHDGDGEVDSRYRNYITNLDNHFGKGPGAEKDKYSIAYTHEKMILRAKL